MYFLYKHFKKKIYRQKNQFIVISVNKYIHNTKYCAPAASWQSRKAPRANIIASAPLRLTLAAECRDNNIVSRAAIVAAKATHFK